MVKKYGKKSVIISVISVLLIVVSMSSCTFMYHRDIDRKAKSWINYFKDEDVEGLFNIFCSDIKDNYADETKEEIKKAFEFIDGDIVSYKYKGEGGGGQSKDNYKTTLYYCYPEYRVETSTGEKYTIRITYNYIWKAKPEYEGVERIRIINYEDDNDAYSGEQVVIGKMYDIHEE